MREENDCAGWYQFDGGGRALLTFGPDDDYRMVGLDDTLFSNRLKMQEDGAFLWEKYQNPIQGRLQSDGDECFLVWQDGKGQTRQARKIQDPPYQVLEIDFHNGPVSLSGSLFIPSKSADSPLAVMIHGSGDSTRDNLWYLSIVHALALDGVAVFLPDKRGCGKSGGDWKTASFADFARDAIAALRSCCRILGSDFRSAGFIGISQGGWIAPLAATMVEEEVDFVVAISSAAVPPNQQLHHETIQTFKQAGFPDWAARMFAPVGVLVPKLRRWTWWRKNGPFDPMPIWESLTIPGLIALGNADELDNVPVSQSVALLQAAREKFQSRLTIMQYHESGHGLKLPGENRIRDDFLLDLCEWIGANS